MARKKAQQFLKLLILKLLSCTENGHINIWWKFEASEVISFWFRPTK